jgi:hypothetical protein
MKNNTKRETASPRDRHSKANKSTRAISEKGKIKQRQRRDYKTTL